MRSWGRPMADPQPINVGHLGTRLSPHMQRYAQATLDIVPWVQRLKERVSPAFAHEHAMLFVTLDTLEERHG